MVKTIFFVTNVSKKCLENFKLDIFTKIYHPSRSFQWKNLCKIFFTCSKNDRFLIHFLFSFTDGKFHQLPTGELLIHNLEFSDQFPPYKCRTMHKLSRHVVVSSPANVRIIGRYLLILLHTPYCFIHRNNL